MDQMEQIDKVSYEERKLAQTQKQIMLPKTVAVIGSGLVGRSWTIVFARAGFDVQLFDSLPNAAQNSLPTIHALGSELHAAGLLRNCSSADELLRKVHVAPTLKDALNGVFWVQECVPENVEMKKAVFKDMDAVLSDPDNTKRFEDEKESIILASSSSAIPASSFTSELSENVRSKCLVAHPVNPVHLIPLVEIVPSPFTLEDVVNDARAFLEQVGQKPIVVKKEIDSFILNRLQGAVLNEAFRLVEDGYVSPEDLDRCMKDGLGLRWSFMGPFETIDLNAPHGVRDYVERYGGNMYKLAQQQADPRKWEGNVVEDVTMARRAMLPLDKLLERAQWRDSRLMGLITHKTHAETLELQKLQ